MKVIDLLNKIAKGEETPKKVKWHGVIFEYIEKTNYEDYINDMNCSLFRHDDDIYKVTNMLDDEIEIIEEEKEIEFEDIEQFGISYNLGFVDYGNIEILKDYLNKDFQTIFDTLDLLIRNQKKLIDIVKELKNEKENN